MPDPQQPADRTPRPATGRPREPRAPLGDARARARREADRHRPGEVEVREGDWRIRVRRPLGATSTAPARRSERPRLGGQAAAHAEPRTAKSSATARARGPGSRHRDLARGRRLPARCRDRDGRPRRRPDRDGRPPRHRPGRHVADRRDARGAVRAGRRGRRVRRGDRGHRGGRSGARGGRRAGRARRGRAEHGQPDPDRQPGRDRAAHPARLPRARDRVRRRLLRGGPRVARPDARRRGDLHRPGGREALVPVGPRDHLRRARDGLRRHPPGLRLPVRGRRVR